MPTPTLLEQFDPTNPETCRKLVEHFVQEWMNKAHSMIAVNIPDIRARNGIETSEILSKAYIYFIEYMKNHPDEKIKNRAHLEAKFATNIRFAIKNTVREYLKQKRDSALVEEANLNQNEMKQKSDDLERQGNGSASGCVVATSVSNDYWNELNSMFNAIDNLPEVEYGESGLSSTTLCNLYYFLGESVSSISTKYSLSSKTISRHLLEIATEIHKHMESFDGLQKDLGVRPVVREIRGSSNVPLQVNDIVVSCNNRILIGARPLMNYLRIIRGWILESKFDFVSMIVQRNGAAGEETLLLELGCAELEGILENVSFSTTSFNPS